MSLTLDGVKYFAPRQGNQKVNDAVNKASPFVQKLEVEKLDGVRNINISPGVLNSAVTITASDTYPTADTSTLTQAIAKPVSRFVHAKVPVDLAEMCSSEKDAITLLKKAFGDAGNSLAVMHERGCLDGYLAGVEVSASISAQAATISVNDCHGLVSGTTFDIYNAAANSKIGSGIVGAITRDGDGTGSFAASSLVDGSGVALTSGIVAGVGLWLAGWLTPVAANRFVSLSDACGSADIYGTTVSGSDWSGFERDLGAALGTDDIDELLDSVAQRGGHEPDMLVCARPVAQDINELNKGQVQFRVGDKLDPVGNNRMNQVYAGINVVKSDRCPGTQLFALSGEGYKLGVKRGFSSLGSQKDGAIVSETTFDYKIKILGMHQGIVDTRNAVGRLKHISINQ